MSDDWLKKSGNNKHGKPPEPDEQQIALDDMGIPILDEVVFVEEDYSFDKKLTFNSISEPSVKVLTEDDNSYLDSEFKLPEDPELLKKHLSRLALESETQHDTAPDLPAESAPADNNIQYKLLREQLRSQLQQDLETMASNIASTVVEKLSVNLKQQIQAELKHTLDYHLDQAIDQVISNISESKDNGE
ncbi:MAG: hypothetical protein GY814_14175 [Gammaproteobacteria bacterium]|nr:hypothetical protein [Gammaproteobacteria bacterium]